METDARALQLRLDAFQLDEVCSVDRFGARLARENGWSLQYAARVVEEYKKFARLAVSANHSVTPSDQVDQAWHLHLTYSDSYWQHFCPEVLGRPLHHHPSKGGTAERRKYVADYEKTLESYRATFGAPPPADIWPDAERRFGADLRHMRVNTSENWILPKRLVSLPVLAMAVVAVPFFTVGLKWALELPGRSFLLVYLSVWALAVAAAVFAKRCLGLVGSDAPLPALDAYEVAYLSGGERLTAQAAIASLVRAEAVALDASTQALAVSAPLPAAVHPVEQALYARLQGSKTATVPELLSDAGVLSSDVAERMLALGLMTNKGSSFPRVLACIAPALGGLKIMLGLSRDKPVGGLFVLCVIGTVVALWGFKPRPGRTQRGEAVLGQLGRAHAALRTGDASTESDPVEALPMAVALFGVGVLVDFELGELSQSFEAAAGATASTGDSAGGDGGGCSGGGCGGCGGCGGGGCGGE